MSSKSGGSKKPGLMMRLFSTERKSSLVPPASPTSGDDVSPEAPPSTADEKLRQRRQRLHRLHSLDAAAVHDRSDGVDARPARPPPHSPRSPTSPPPASPKSAAAAGRPHSAGKSRHGSSSSSSTVSSPRTPLSPSEPPRTPTTAPDSAKSLPTPPPPPLAPGRALSQDGDHRHHSHHGRKKHLPSSTSLPADSAAAPRSPQPVSAPPQLANHPPKLVAAAAAAGTGKKLRHRKRVKKKDDRTSAKIDTSRPLEFPTTPELILDYHRQKPFLNQNEEWLVVELNEYECLVDGIEILRIIAKHSKFFEVEPDQLWEEFFEFVEDVPSYDDIVNYDVWQEFRDVKYPC